MKVLPLLLVIGVCGHVLSQSKIQQIKQLKIEVDSLNGELRGLQGEQKRLEDSLKSVTNLVNLSNLEISKLRKQLRQSEFFLYEGVHWSPYNLDVVTFRNGDTIMQAQSKELWEKAGFAKQPAWCYYQKKDGTIDSSAGKLYNRYAIMDPRGLAPDGWEISSYAEWFNLEESLLSSDYTFHDLVSSNAGTSRFWGLNFNFGFSGMRDVGFFGWGEKVTYWLANSPFQGNENTSTVSISINSEESNGFGYLRLYENRIFQFDKTSWNMGHYVRCIFKN